MKRRAANAIRTVPIPSELVELLRAHLAEHGAGTDGRVFQNERGGPFNEAGARRAWARARLVVLTADQVASPLARPYDLRHAAASLWLNGGVSATEVVRPLGHDVAVLLKIYANCIDGQEEAINDQISAALRGDRDRERLAPAPPLDKAGSPTSRTSGGPEPDQ